MRLWSLHPKYLDTKGLLAVWREGLLAKKVLEGNTKGYKNHPQLYRFKNSRDSLLMINSFLSYVWQEADFRNYKFDQSKIDFQLLTNEIKVNDQQVGYEFQHLLRKLKSREISRYDSLKNLEKVEVCPLFQVQKGEIEEWEVL